MDIFEVLREALVKAVARLPKLNRENRKIIRETILLLQAELERALTMAMYYLDGASRIKEKQELIEHLSLAPQKLLESYNQYKICSGIYGLADEFKEAFTSLPGALDIQSIESVKSLITSLAGGENMVVDGLRNTTLLLADCANELVLLDGDEYENKKREVLARVSLERANIRNRIDWFEKSIADILKMM